MPPEKQQKDQFQTPVLQSTQEQIDTLKKDLKALNDEVYRNNFSAHQDFNKFSNFTTNIKVPHYTTLPSVCDVGELVEVGGKLYVGSAVNVWALVGTQT